LCYAGAADLSLSYFQALTLAPVGHEVERHQCRALRIASANADRLTTRLQSAGSIKRRSLHREHVNSRGNVSAAAMPT
jgi:hypothetical protein